LDVLDVYQTSSGKKTVFAVVNDNIEKPQQYMQQALASDNSNTLPALEVIDRSTLETIQRLVEAGVLTINAKSESLPHSCIKKAIFI